MGEFVLGGLPGITQFKSIQSRRRVDMYDLNIQIKIQSQVLNKEEANFVKKHVRPEEEVLGGNIGHSFPRFECFVSSF